MGSPDLKLHRELTLLKDFASRNAKGFSFLPELRDALGESRADCAMLQLSQGTRSRTQRWQWAKQHPKECVQ